LKGVKKWISYRPFYSIKQFGDCPACNNQNQRERRKWQIHNLTSLSS
jgi:hypothetical protein